MQYWAVLRELDYQRGRRAVTETPLCLLQNEACAPHFTFQQGILCNNRAGTASGARLRCTWVRKAAAHGGEKRGWLLIGTHTSFRSSPGRAALQHIQQRAHCICMFTTQKTSCCTSIIDVAAAATGLISQCCCTEDALLWLPPPARTRSAHLMSRTPPDAVLSIPKAPSDLPVHRLQRQLVRHSATQHTDATCRKVIPPPPPQVHQPQHHISSSTPPWALP